MTASFSENDPGETTLGSVDMEVGDPREIEPQLPVIKKYRVFTCNPWGHGLRFKMQSLGR